MYIHSFIFKVCSALLLPFVFSKIQKTPDVIKELELLEEIVEEFEEDSAASVGCGGNYCCDEGTCWCCQWVHRNVCYTKITLNPFYTKHAFCSFY